MRSDDEIEESRNLNAVLQAQAKRNNDELRDFKVWWKTQNSICEEIALSGWMARANKEKK